MKKREIIINQRKILHEHILQIDIIEYAYTQNIFTVYKCKKARFELLQLQGKAAKAECTL